jgi:hypothetical protein
LTEISKPDYSTGLWSSGGAIVAPSNVKIQTGWTAEVPPFQWENWSQNRQDQAIAHILQHGISVWDGLTEYRYDVSGTKSLVMGSDGIIYRAKQINTNQNPVVDVAHTYWDVAFASTTDAYTKATSDSRYAQLANNLSDLSNTTTARTNLSVYSQAQVDAKTTLATTAQAQAWVNTTALLTPSLLASAFQGSNQSLTSGGGWQKIPGGLILQWGAANTSAGTGVWNYPIAFPTAALQIFASQDAATSGASLYAVGADFVTGTPLTQARIASQFTAGADQIFLFAIGK